MLREKLGAPRDQSIPPIMIGAGLNKNFRNPRQLQQHSQAAATTHGAVVIGSITPRPRPGNNGELFYAGDGFTLNAYGMQNDGVEAMPSVAPFPNLIVSLAGDTVEDYIVLYDKMWNWGLGVELNFGCPNKGNGKRIMSFDPDAMRAVLEHIRRLSMRPANQQIIGIKLSPYSDPMLLAEVAEMLSRFEGTLDYVATCNTFPNAKAYRRAPRDGKPAIVCETTKDRGGLGGQALREIRLGQIEQFDEALVAAGSSIEVVGVGGIRNGLDILESQDSGAVAVQVVSAVTQSINPVYSMINEFTIIAT